MKFKIRTSILILIILPFLGMLPEIAFSQLTKEQLTADKKSIEKEISYTNKLLKETKKSKKTSLNQLVILNNKIVKRERLISTISSEVKLFDNKIDENQKNIRQLKNDLSTLKEEYAKMIYFAFKNRNIYQRMVFVFSSEDFNQAYRRLKYFQQYGSYRKTQAKLITETQVELNQKTLELEDQKLEKISLLKSKEKEVRALTLEKQEKNSAIKELGKKEKSLASKLKAKEKDAKKLQKAIEEIIAKEIRAAAKRAKAETANTVNTMPKQDMQISASFSTNKGRLSWPSENGIISSTFGEHRHPVLKRVKTKNNGINILTSKGSVARSVFEGTVISVKYITNTNVAVIIRHGEYFSVYSNLKSVFVQRGDKVKAKQELGIIYSNPQDNKTELHFEIWKGKTLQNPAYWILANN
jgi:murein hydrolase activator